MNYNFSMEDCNFYVDEENRTIACVLEGTKDMFHEYCSEKLYISPWCFFSNSTVTRFTTSLDMPNRFVGIARCAPEDVWNVALGKKIAYMRLREKVYRSFFNKARHYINTFDDYLERSAIEINRMGEKLDKELESRNQYIAEKIGEKNA